MNSIHNKIINIGFETKIVSQFEPSKSVWERRWMDL